MGFSSITTVGSGFVTNRLGVHDIIPPLEEHGRGEIQHHLGNSQEFFGTPYFR